MTVTEISCNSHSPQLLGECDCDKTEARWVNVGDDVTFDGIRGFVDAVELWDEPGFVWLKIHSDRRGPQWVRCVWHEMLTIHPIEGATS